MTFLWPFMLLTVLLVPVGFLASRRISERRRARVSELTGVAVTGGAAVNGATSQAPPAGASRAVGRVLAALPAALVTGAVIVLCVALARPQATVALPRLEGTVMLLFDVSGSMAADDVTPTRMEAAKAAAKAIVEARPDGVVIGVVAFSDAGLAVQEPTSDQAAVEAAIERMAPARGTSLGSGILATLQAIDKARAGTPRTYYSNQTPEPTATPAPVAPGSDASTMIVVLSDGENNERPDPQAAAQVAANRGIRVVTLGVGTAQGTTLDLDGFRVQTKLDEAALQSIADRTDGAYLPVAEATAGVYDQLARALVVRDENVELTGLVAAIGLALLVGGVAISLARGGRLP
jgi:Ca-activated chloride channel family protein